MQEFCKTALACLKHLNFSWSNNLFVSIVERCSYLSRYLYLLGYHAVGNIPVVPKQEIWYDNRHLIYAYLWDSLILALRRRKSFRCCRQKKKCCIFYNWLFYLYVLIYRLCWSVVRIFLKCLNETHMSNFYCSNFRDDPLQYGYKWGYFKPKHKKCFPDKYLASIHGRNIYILRKDEKVKTLKFLDVLSKYHLQQQNAMYLNPFFRNAFVCLTVCFVVVVVKLYFCLIPYCIIQNTAVWMI